MSFDFVRARPLLQSADLKRLFIEELGWEPCHNTIAIPVNDTNYELKAIAEKKGFVVWQHTSHDNRLPDHNTRLKLERKLSETSFEHLIVFLSSDKSRQLWMWVKREPSRPLRPRTFEYMSNQPGDSLLTKLQHLYISLEEEEQGISITQVAQRARTAFDVERVTKRFYDRFKKEHAKFLDFIEAIPIPEDREWYASVMLNRLMFLYFIQKKGFLDGDPHYLRNRLRMMQARFGKDRFYSFYRYFLLRLFHEGLGKIKHSPELEELLGRVPYINGGIFDVHPVEEKYGHDIQIPDSAFESIFDYFDEYDWVLDPERSIKSASGREEINPDILGYIFEKYINQKEMGAYYTKEDITEYISKNTIIPFIFDRVKSRCKSAFENSDGKTIWNILQENPDRYIYHAVRHGITWDVYNDRPLGRPLSLPENIANGLNPSTLHNIVGEVESINDILTIKLRKDWNKPAPSEYALPTEIWREVIARRQRYEEVKKKILSGEIRDINDFITYNLDIRQFAQDVIANCESPELLRAFWGAIRDITVLDPTCGSGAFLFTALNILEPLYESCLDRMEEMLKDEAAKHNGKVKYTPHGYPLLPHKKMEDFSNILEMVENHPNRQYFIYKSIILNNLYGVDIMEEAVEICKLRLFLKLAAQVDPDPDKPNFGIEPLPDMDFNIRAGNTLVGFARYEDVERAVTTKFDFENSMQKITTKAADLQQAFDAFRRYQTEGDGIVPPEHKQEIRSRLKALEEELNKYLAGEYGIDVNKRSQYEQWLKTHQPFHWFIEFYGIVHEKGGFDVIIGNPPYVEYNKVKKQYTIKGYETEECGNLYAFVVERGDQLLVKQGDLGLIVPISLPSTPRMEPVRKILTQNSDFTWCSTYADRPGSLFTGVHQKLSIILFKKSLTNTQNMLLTTAYKHWYSKENKDERKHLMEVLIYYPSTDNSLCWLKGGSSIEKEIIRKIASQQCAISKNFHGQSSFYLAMRMMYWGKCFTELMASNEYKKIQTTTELDKKILVSVFNSTLYFWFWEIISDGWHITSKELDSFLLDLNQMSTFIKAPLSEFTDKLMEDLDNKKCYVGTKQTKYEYYHKLSKPIIDEIDCVLARHYGFTEEELDFIINYDIKYRMGITADGEDEEG
ncbi:hypothetical protein JZK55_19930 [Dissulfurispira thermophila]|uniref:site-specific DNA-methyltransferase (adenine-specific) n=1 Tax=Dissulfurispira thermophila TaxID=2715679 RepID=A0A7G1H4J6_9BACT|nr:DNA methyltransferase [Dissulfurispira thermophila]BCB97071.1 hypothetical protein JZK55_19930 [Dissulfurispira thermophila]